MSKMKYYLMEMQEHAMLQVNLSKGGILRKTLEDLMVSYCERVGFPTLFRDIEYVIDDLIDEGTIVVGEKTVAWRNHPITVLLPKGV